MLIRELTEKKKPRVKVDVEYNMKVLNVIAQGLKIVPEYYVVESCMHTLTINKDELFTSYDVMRNAFFIGKG